MYLTIAVPPVGFVTVDFACRVHHQPWLAGGPEVTEATVPYHLTVPPEYVFELAVAHELGSRMLLPPPAGGIRYALPTLPGTAACESTETPLLIPASARELATCCAFWTLAFRWLPAVKTNTPASAIAKTVMTSRAMTSDWPRSFRKQLRARRVMRPPRFAASWCRSACRGRRWPVGRAGGSRPAAD